MADNQLDESETIAPDEQDSSGKESELTTLLAEWDNKMSKSFDQPPEEKEIIPRDEDEIREFEERIESLESEKSDLTERLEQSEVVTDFIEETVTIRDQHEFDRTIERFMSETGISKRVAELELKQQLLEDPDFLAAADDRFDNPERFESMVCDLIEDLHEQYPHTQSIGGDEARGLVRAYRVMRSAHVGGGGYDENDYGNFSKMSDQEFAVATERVFEDMRAGKLKAEGRPRGGCLTTYPR